MKHHPSRAAALAIVLLLASCTGTGDSADTTTATPEPELKVDPVPTTAPVDTSTFTPEYVQQTMNTIDASYGAMVRRLRDDGGPTPETDEWLELLFTEDALEGGRQVTASIVDAEFANLRDDPQGPTTEARGLVTVSPDCLYAEVQRSYEPLVQRVIDESRTDGYVALRRARPDRVDPEGTPLPPWTVVFEGFTESGDAPADPCA